MKYFPHYFHQKENNFKQNIKIQTTQKNNKLILIVEQAQENPIFKTYVQLREEDKRRVTEQLNHTERDRYFLQDSDQISPIKTAREMGREMTKTPSSNSKLYMRDEILQGDKDDRLKHIEERSKEMSRTLEKIAISSARNSERVQTGIAQQYQELRKEAKEMYSKTINDLTEKNKKLSTELVQKDLEVEEIRAISANIEAKLKEERDIAKIEVQKCQNLLINQQENIQQIEKELQSYKYKSATEQRLNVAQKEEVFTRMKEEMDEINEKNLELNAKLKEKNEHISQLQTSHAKDIELLSELDQYKKQAELAESELAYTKRKLEELQISYVNSENKAEKLLSQIKQMKEEETNKIRLEAERIQKMQELSRALSEVEARSGRIAQELSQMKYEYEKSKREKEEIQKALDDQELLIRNLRSDNEILNEEISTLRSYSEKRAQLLENLKSKKDSKTHDILLQEKEELEEKVKEYEKRLYTIDLEMETTKLDLKSKEETIESLKGISAKLQEENRILSHEAKIHKVENEKLLAELEVKCGGIESKSKVLMSDNLELKTSNEILSKQLLEIQKEKELISENNRRLKKQQKLMKIQVQEIEKQISQLSYEREIEHKDNEQKLGLTKQKEFEKMHMLQEVQSKIAAFKEKRK